MRGGLEPSGVALRGNQAEVSGVWNQPYLETCCRAALHRLYLAADDGRPGDRMDAPCLIRLSGMGLSEQCCDGRFVLTPDGARRHATEVLKQAPAATKVAR
jgi:hypothetical protein